MKKILITGANSYVGTNVEKWLMKEPDKYYVETLDMKDPNWKEFDFSKFDVVFHVAGIVHKRERKKDKDIYFKINKDLVLDVAKKCIADGVNHFIFMSSMSVYGIDSGVIDNYSNTNPKSIYGKSKLAAESLLMNISDRDLKISIIRAPMIYGKNCTGNYKKLQKIVMKTYFFPEITNKRSMIYIENLAEIIKQIINSGSIGIFCPHNKEYVSTTEMARFIAKLNDRKIIFTKLFNPIINIFNYGILRKVFGTLIYDKSVSCDNDVVSFEESIKISESNSK